MYTFMYKTVPLRVKGKSFQQQRPTIRKIIMQTKSPIVPLLITMGEYKCEDISQGGSKYFK